MAKGIPPKDTAQPPPDFPAVAPAVELYPMTDIRLVIIQQQKLTTEVEHLTAAIKTSNADLKELRNWLMVGLGIIGAAGIGAVIWANGKFEDDAKQLAQLSQATAVMQAQASAIHDDIKDIKYIVLKNETEKTVPKK
jgi:hypothetical protein